MKQRVAILVAIFAAIAILIRMDRNDPVLEPSPITTPAVANTVEADVQVALILDTSSSMDGLLNQARTQISDMIADLRIDRDGKNKTVAVTIYHYGNSSASEASGYVEELAPFTLDVGKIQQGLERVRVGGEREFAPSAIKKAVLDSNWSDKPGVQKLIVIVGNEGFAQGPLGVQEVMDLTRSHNIAVVPIYCADRSTSKAAVSSWRRVAGLAGVEFMSIDPNQHISSIETPLDAELMAKYRKLYRDEQRNLDIDALPPVAEYRKGQSAASAPSAEDRQLRKEIEALQKKRSAYLVGSAKKDSSNLRSSFNRGAKSVLKGY